MKFSTPLSTLSVCILTALIARPLLAQPGSGIRLGEATILIPQLTLSYNYDDNVNIRRRAQESTLDPINVNESDTYYEYSASLALRRVIGNRSVRGTVWYGQNFYQSFSELDGENYGINLGHFWAPPSGKTTIDISAGYEHAVDRAGDYDNRNVGSNQGITNFETISERVERDVLSAEARLTQNMFVDDLGTAFLAGFYDTDYADEVYNDRTGLDFSAELNYQLSVKTQPYGQLGYSIDRDDGLVEDAEKPYFLLGARYNPTPKTRIDLSVGYEEYTRTPWLISYGRDEEGRIVETGREPGIEQFDSGLKYRATIGYEATQKSSLTLRAGNGYDSVSAGLGNSRRENSVSLSFRHQTTPRINQSVLVNWRKDEYYENQREDNEESFREVKETIRYEYRLDYQTVRAWLNLFGNINYEDGESQIENESYDQLRISLGLRMQY